MLLFCVASAPAGNLKARFENMAKASDEENRKQAEEEKARRQAREKREQEEARQRQQVVRKVIKTQTRKYNMYVYSMTQWFMHLPRNGTAGRWRRWKRWRRWRRWKRWRSSHPHRYHRPGGAHHSCPGHCLRYPETSTSQRYCQLPQYEGPILISTKVFQRAIL